MISDFSYLPNAKLLAKSYNFIIDLWVMNLTTTQLRSIISAFLKEQFEVDKFRIGSAIPSEFPKGKNPVWVLSVHYNTPAPSNEVIGNLKIPLSISHSLLIVIDDEEKKVLSWNES